MPELFDEVAMPDNVEQFRRRRPFDMVIILVVHFVNISFFVFVYERRIIEPPFAKIVH